MNVCARLGCYTETMVKYREQLTLSPRPNQMPVYNPKSNTHTQKLITKDGWAKYRNVWCVDPNLNLTKGYFHIAFSLQKWLGRAYRINAWVEHTHTQKKQSLIHVGDTTDTCAFYFIYKHSKHSSSRKRERKRYGLCVGIKRHIECIRSIQCI